MYQLLFRIYFSVCIIPYRTNFTSFGEQNIYAYYLQTGLHTFLLLTEILINRPELDAVYANPTFSNCPTILSKRTESDTSFIRVDISFIRW